MFVNSIQPSNGIQLKITGYPAGLHPAWTGKARGAAQQTAAYFAALKLITRIDDGLTQGNPPYQDKATGKWLTLLDEGVRAILTNSLVVTASLCQACLHPNPAQPDYKGQCAAWGGQTCRCLVCLDTLARRRARERNQASRSVEAV